MLSTLIIKNFVIIDDLRIDFEHGFNVVTGETGAGKSIIIGAIQLLLGQRADKSQIRTGQDSCEIHGIFQLSKERAPSENINRFLEGVGVTPCESDELILARTISPKNARNFINSCPVTLNVMSQLGDLLIDVHGPYDHQSLLKPKTQLELLDGFGQLHAERQAFADLYAELRAAQRDLDALETDALSPERYDILKFQVNEIETAGVTDGEDDEIASRHAIAAGSTEILGVLNNSLTRLTTDDGIEEQMSGMLRDIQVLSKFDSKSGKHFTELLESVIAETNNLGEELQDYADRIDIDPAELLRLDERLSLILKLKRKYGGSINEIQKYATRARKELEKLDNLDEHRERSREAVERIEKKSKTRARALSKKRRERSAALQKQVTSKLKDLGFNDCLFDISIIDRPMSASGCNSIEFMFRPNQGEESKPLRTIASSGEISRVMLAIKSVLAAVDDIPVLLFDEIDVNIGGTVATAVGRELLKLSRCRQVICITHLPQVAAGADFHYMAGKTASKKRTEAKVVRLSESERVNEITRMLGGADSSSVATTHASELIKKSRHDS